MTSSRLVFGLLTVMLVLALVPSAFAQVNVQLIPNTSPGEIQTNRNAQTADPASGAGAGILVSGALVAPAPLTTTNLVLTYAALITSSTTIPTTDFIRIEGATGVFATVSNPTINTTLNTVTIILPGLGTAGNPNSQSGSFRLVGVRLDVNGKTAPLSTTAALSSSANSYILQTPSFISINALGAGIANFAVGARSGQTDLGTATVFTNRNIVDPTGSFILTEGFATAWRTTTQLSNNTIALATNSTQIRLTFNNVPTGVTLTLSTMAGSSITTAFSVSNPTITTAANTSTISFQGASMISTETIMIAYTITLSSTAAPAAGTITATATQFPIGDALYEVTTGDGIFTATATGGYPRFVQADVGPITVVNVVPANTTLLMPYAAVISPFDTGLAVANTTADPFGLAGGGATPSSGSISLSFYPTLPAGGPGTSWTLTTSSTVKPGVGLSSDGTLAAGATWTVNLSQVMAAAGQTGSFVGYVFIQANFLNAHGTATISDYRTFSLSAHVLVLPPPATSSRNAPLATNGETNGGESLGY